MNSGEIFMKTRHLAITAAVVMLLGACTQSGFRNWDTVVEGEGIAVFSVNAVERNAAAGNPAAQRTLGNMYYWGEYLEQSEAKAIAWWSRAADKGDAIAQLNLGRVTAGEPVEGSMHARVGREIWASTD